MRCHTEFLKAQLELRAAELGWVPPKVAAESEAYARWEQAWPIPCDFGCPKHVIESSLVNIDGKQVKLHG